MRFGTRWVCDGVLGLMSEEEGEEVVVDGGAELPMVEYREGP